MRCCSPSLSQGPHRPNCLPHSPTREWEYAARAGSTGARYGPLDTIAWYADNSGKQRVDSNELRRTGNIDKLFENGNGPHPVGQKQPNAWGLYDMLGNSEQWTADWYDPLYYLRGENRDPQGPPTGQEKMLRGGNWFVFPYGVRVSQRRSVAYRAARHPESPCGGEGRRGSSGH